MVENIANTSNEKILKMKLLPPADHLKKPEALLFSRRRNSYLANTVPLPPGKV